MRNGNFWSYNDDGTTTEHIHMHGSVSSTWSDAFCVQNSVVYHLLLDAMCAIQTEMCHNDDVIIWKHFLRYWPFVRGIHRSPVNSPHKGQLRGNLMLSLISAWINCLANNRETGDLKRHQAHYDVTVMIAHRDRNTWLRFCHNTQYDTIYIHHLGVLHRHRLISNWSKFITFIVYEISICSFTRLGNCLILPIIVIIDDTIILKWCICWYHAREY